MGSSVSECVISVVDNIVKLYFGLAALWAMESSTSTASAELQVSCLGGNPRAADTVLLRLGDLTLDLLLVVLRNLVHLADHVILPDERTLGAQSHQCSIVVLGPVLVAVIHVQSSFG